MTVEQSDFVKWAIASIDKQISKLSESTLPNAGTMIFSLLVEKVRLEANPQEQWKCHYPTHPRPGRR